MGYYSGNGVTSGGGETTSLMRTGPSPEGAYYLYQRVKTTTNTKNGVALSAAQVERADMSLNWWRWPGGLVEPGCRGTKKSVQYSQIGDSNLYALQVTDEIVQVRGKVGSYDSGWVS